MAVTVIKNLSGLKLRFDCSKSEETGKIIIKYKTYSNVNPDALDDVHAVGVVLSSLQNFTLLEVAK